MHGPDGQAAVAQAGREALALTGRDYLSPSAVRTYQTCPLKFHFQYVARLEPEFISASLAFGCAFHSAVQQHYTARFQDDPPPGLETLLEVYDQAWELETQGTVRFGPGESRSGLHDLARRMLAAFLASDAAALDGELLGVEEEFRGAVIPGCPDILGRVDLVVRTSQALRVLDFKTSRTAWSPAKEAESAQQLLLYAGLVAPLAQACGTRSIELAWCVLTKTREPQVQVRTLAYGAPDLARVQGTVRRVWEAIRQRHFYPAPSSLNCPGCPFQGACRAWEG